MSDQTRPLSQLRPSRRSVLAATALAVPAGALVDAEPAFASRRAAHARATALTWFDLTNTTVTAAAFPEPVTQSRTWAVSWLAAARATRPGADPVQRTAAFAQALHDTLVALVPSQQASVDSALAATLASLPRHSGAVRHGRIAGRRAAARTLAERAGDGLDTASVDVAWTAPAAAPGVFQPTPPVTRPAIRAGQGKARPFLLHRNDQFDPGTPYSLDSAAYLADLAEVRAIGAKSAPRTSEQTEVAQFWYPAINGAHVQITRALIAAQPKATLAELARFVAAFHVITTDAQIAVYHAKYTHEFWRPATAITTGAVAPDPSWTSFSVAPQHPEYPSGHGGQIGAQQAVLEALVGKHSPVAIALTSSAAPGVTRTYSDWASITQDVVDARVWEGVHFRTSDRVGVDVGVKLARWELGQLHRLGL